MAATAARRLLCTEDPVFHAAQRIGCSTAITDDDPAMVHGCQPTLFIRIAAASMLALALTGRATRNCWIASAAKDRPRWLS